MYLSTTLLLSQTTTTCSLKCHAALTNAALTNAALTNAALTNAALTNAALTNAALTYVKICPTLNMFCVINTDCTLGCTVGLQFVLYC